MAAKATKSAKRIKLRVNDELPPLNPETDDWPELIRYCNALARRAGLTKEESDRIREQVRREIYGDRC